MHNDRYQLLTFVVLYWRSYSTAHTAFADLHNVAPGHTINPACFSWFAAAVVLCCWQRENPWALAIFARVASRARTLMSEPVHFTSKTLRNETFSHNTTVVSSKNHAASNSTKLTNRTIQHLYDTTNLVQGALKVSANQRSSANEMLPQS